MVSEQNDLKDCLPRRQRKVFLSKVSTSENAYQEHFNELKEIIQHAIKSGTSKRQLMQYH